MGRQQNLIKLSAHPINSKLFSKLTQSELDFVIGFVKDNEHLDRNEYMAKANRLFIDGQKPKHHTDMWAILTQLED